MRNPDRLDAFYSELCELHKKYAPDIRVGQLFVILTSMYGDPFYWEEDKMIQTIRDYFKEHFT